MTTYFQETQPPSFLEGTNDFARYYGLMIDGLAAGYVNGFGYIQILPPTESEIPERLARAEEVFAKKLWREQLREWDEERKPAAVATDRELQAVDPDTLSRSELVDYLVRCRDHHAAMITQHMRYTMAAVIPTGDFLGKVGVWTGLPPSELLDLMQGAAEVSGGGSPELSQLKEAFEKDPAAQDLLMSDGDPAEVLAQLRAIKGETGSAVAEYLNLVGNRLLNGFDISEPTALEMPDALLRSMRLSLSDAKESETDIEKRIAAVRAKVAAENQGEFDELLHEARLMYRLRDERGVYSDIWASGLMRRAALAAGRVVAGDGRIAAPEHMLEASLDEMCALVQGNGGPSAEVLAERARYRNSHNAKEAPPFLGPPKPPPPDLSTMPPNTQRMMGAAFIALDQVFGSSQAEHEEKVLHGLAGSKGIYEGPARCVSGTHDFGRIVKGDVLVTESTTEAFNILLPLLGGIVTDAGGLLSHAAIVAREYQIPSVVGTREATLRITDGTMVRVDGNSGDVTVL
jgi:pyruvate,water dikinase